MVPNPKKANGSITVEIAGTLVLICIVLFMVTMLIRLVIAKDMLDYITVQTSQCIKYGNNDMGYCLQSAASEMTFIDSSKISATVNYYDSLLAYPKASGVRKAKGIATVNLSYTFIPEMTLLNSLFPERTVITSTAVVRIEK